ncbi:MAG: hypothetical protein NT178_17550 [Proteobacteria bacterium]|nr:hypothetical protein [Pseudomonadota bacterium]
MIQKDIEDKLNNKKGPISIERAFVTVAKRILKEETYEMILDEAKFLVDEAEANYKDKLMERTMAGKPICRKSSSVKQKKGYNKKKRK